jgi:hypothetical protein
MKEFKINSQQIEVLKHALNEGTYPFAAKNISILFDMLNKLPAVEEVKSEEK